MTDEGRSAPFALERTVRLPRDEAFYTKERAFPFSVASDGCSAQHTVGDKLVQLSIAPALQPHVERVEVAGIRASLAQVTEAAMQFFQGGQDPHWPAELYADKLHFLRYDVGLAFQDGEGDSVSLARDDVLHGEARRPLIELVGYGLSVLATAKMLDINNDRFAFLLGSTSRPDFAAEITANELASDHANIKALTGNGLRIGIESKARSSHCGFLTNDGKANDLLQSLLKKFASVPEGEAMLGYLVSSQRAPFGKGVTRITLADPGSPSPLSSEEELRFLLGALVPKLRRIGAWRSLHSAVEWLTELGNALSAQEVTFLARTPQSDSFLLTETLLGVDYKGRIFSELLFRLGSIVRLPGLSRQEIEGRLATGAAGAHFFHGLREDVLDALHRRDAATILGLGVGIDAPPSTIRLPAVGAALDQGVLSQLRQALPYAI